MSRFLAASGSTLRQMEFDGAVAKLLQTHANILPANIQYVAKNPAKPIIYVACSNGRTGNASWVGDSHSLVCLRENDRQEFELFGPVVQLATRPIHISVDGTGDHLLVAHNRPSHVSVHKLTSDGSLGAPVPQAGDLDFGIFAHQVLVSPDHKTVIVVARGNDAVNDTPEEPGSLHVFDYAEGELRPAQKAAPNGGYGFGPRHIDFHPSRPWIYACLERENEICMFGSDDRGRLTETPLFRSTCLFDPQHVAYRQIGGTICVHPNGRFVYCVSRATQDIPGGRSILTGGENTIIAYAIDPTTGEPKLIEFARTFGMHARTISIDPSGQFLIAANKSPIVFASDGGEHIIPAGLDIFRIRSDGSLLLVANEAVAVGDAALFWAGFL